MKTPTLVDFLNERRVTVKGGEYTHLSMNGGITGQGKYYIDPGDLLTFWELYTNAVAVNQQTICLIERHQKYGPVVFDIDIKYKKVGNDDDVYRICNDAFIHEFSAMISRAISKYIVTKNQRICIYNLQKKQIPSMDQNDVYKDGIHVVIPDIITDSKTQHVIRADIVIEIQNWVNRLPDHIIVHTKPKDIVDISVIEKNGWMIYGSCKPNHPPYMLHSIWELHESNLTKLSCHQYPNEAQLIRRLSIRERDHHDLVDLTQMCENQLKRYESEEKMKATATSSSNRPSNYYTGDIDEIKEIVLLLNTSRADNFNEWIRVGWALHNIDNNRLFNCWLDFSLSSDKYPESEIRESCHTYWNKMKNGNGLYIGTLLKWAKEDNTNNDRYETFTNNSLDKLIIECCKKSCYMKAKDEDSDETKLAKFTKAPWQASAYYAVRVLVKKYQYQLVCSSFLKQKEWYEFQNHKWKPSAGIQMHLNEDAYKIFETKSHEYYAKAHSISESPTSNSEDIKKKKALFLFYHNACRHIADQMRHTVNKGITTNEAAEQLYWQHPCYTSQPGENPRNEPFEAILNSKTNLLGFENGVYDFNTFSFREGQCEDYISFSTGHNYDNTYSMNSPEIIEIKHFIDQVLPEKEVQDYVIYRMAFFLQGNPAEKFHIFVGSGGNGKSKLLELLQHAIGDYAGGLPVTALTGKRPDSNGATPEIVRLVGRRVVCLEEPNNKEILQPGRLKELTGGDKLYARQLHKEGFEFKPQFNMILCANSNPGLQADDGGIWRRVVVVRFPSRFVENPDPNDPTQFPLDTTLSKKLKTWGGAFLWYLLEKYSELYQVHKGYNPVPETIRLETQKCREANDKISKFVHAKIDVTSKDMTKILYKDELSVKYNEWAKQNGYRGNIDTDGLTDYLINNGYGDLVSIGDTKKLGWKGICFFN